MTVRLTVDRAAWQAHVQATFAAERGLVPVVKGNGYGFGRPLLHDAVLAAGAAEVCVGTVHEVADVPAGLQPIVLTPTLAPPTGTNAVLTVGNLAHVAALIGAAPGRRVIVKLASSMRRYGATPQELPALLEAVHAAGLEVAAFGVHLPLAGDDADRLAEIEAWLPHLPAGTPLWVSHLSPASMAMLRTAHPGREWRVRVGTALWHGVPKGPFLHLSVDVLHTQPVAAGDTAGYFRTTVPHDGTLVALGGGSAHGIAPLDDLDQQRRSPFHFARHRLPLLERPQMHTSMVVVPAGQPCPQVGDRVDLQRPLITTAADEIEWR